MTSTESLPLKPIEVDSPRPTTSRKSRPPSLSLNSSPSNSPSKLAIPRMSRPSSRQNSNADPSGSIEGSGDENGEPSEPTLGRWREASPRARDDKFDRDRDQGGNGDDDGGQSTPDAEEVDRLLRLPDDAEASDSDGDESPGGLATPSGSNRIGGQWESSWGEDGFSPASAGSGWSDSHLTRGQKRRVYGGGRHGEAMQGGGLGAGEVAGLLLAGT